jgi:hypothetical protein
MTIFDRNPLTALSKDTRAIWYYYAKTGDLREPANYSEEVAEQMLDRTGMPLGIEKRPPIYDDQVAIELPVVGEFRGTPSTGTTLSQAMLGPICMGGSMEGATHRTPSPNSNGSQERPLDQQSKEIC